MSIPCWYWTLYVPILEVYERAIPGGIVSFLKSLLISWTSSAGRPRSMPPAATELEAAAERLALQGELEEEGLDAAIAASETMTVMLRPQIEKVTLADRQGQGPYGAPPLH
jgi:hypothetical protein